MKESLKGYFNEFNRMMLESHYKHYQLLTREIAAFGGRISQAMEPYASQTKLLVSIPGGDRLVAWHLPAELGVDLKAFPDADHCSSWAGKVPGENESDGKQKSTRCRKGNRTLRRIPAQAAWAASHCKKGYLRAFFHRIKGRGGWAKAIVATGHKISPSHFRLSGPAHRIRNRATTTLTGSIPLELPGNTFRDSKHSAIRYNFSPRGQTLKTSRFSASEGGVF